MNALCRQQLVHYRWQAAGAEILLAEIFSRRLHVDDKRHVVAVFLPILDAELDAGVARNRVDMDRRVGRAADCRIGDDGVLERLAGQDVGRLQILVHDFHRAHAGLVGHLAALAIRRRDCGAARQRHAERFGERIHGRGGAHGVAVASRRRRRRCDLQELLIVDAAGSEFLARLPHRHARAAALALPPTVQHRSAGQDDCRQVHGRRRHQAGRRGLVAAGHQHHAVERIAIQHLDQAKVREVAVERGGRPLAGLLDGMAGKFECDAAGRADALAHAMRQFEVMAVARRKVGAGLRDADDRLAGAQLLAGQTEVQIALEVERRHARVLRVVEPELGAQLLAARDWSFCLLRHDRSSTLSAVVS